MLASEICGVGAYVPPGVMTNHDLEELLNTSDEWIQQRTGIVQRHWADGDTSTSDLAVEACRDAISDAGIQKEDIDMIIFASLSPDHEFPGNGCFLQAKLGIPGVPAIDIRQQCTGFVYGLSIADNFIKSGQYKNVLLVGAELHSKGLDKTPEGRDVSVLFGDGAGAVVVRATEVQDKDKDSHVILNNLHADGSCAEMLWLPGPGTGLKDAERLTHTMIDEKLHYPKMNGRQVFTHAVKRMAESLSMSIQSQNLSIDDIDLFLFHQANLRINDKVGEIMGINPDKVFNTIQNYGNTTAATIPIGMRDAVKAGRLKKGMLVGIAAFGSGFTWGSGIFRY